jgi:hypothetical protein
MNEFIYDKIFILNGDQTLPDDLAALTVAAVNAASDLKLTQVPSFDDVKREDDGDFYTAANSAKEENLYVATVGVAWFKDRRGLKHVRVIGATVKSKSWKSNRLWPAHLVPAEVVYPGVRWDGSGYTLHCKCGRQMACEAPRWNGRTCEICQELEQYAKDNDGAEVYLPAQKRRQK